MNEQLRRINLEGFKILLGLYPLVLGVLQVAAEKVNFLQELLVGFFELLSVLLLLKLAL